MLFVLRNIHYLQICSWNANFNKNYPYIKYNYSGETLNELRWLTKEFPRELKINFGAGVKSFLASYFSSKHGARPPPPPGILNSVITKPEIKLKLFNGPTFVLNPTLFLNEKKVVESVVLLLTPEQCENSGKSIEGPNTLKKLMWHFNPCTLTWHSVFCSDCYNIQIISCYSQKLQPSFSNE